MRYSYMGNGKRRWKKRGGRKIGYNLFARAFRRNQRKRGR